ncbi:MAG TPA: hypothetical protein VMU48_01040 [Terracidiphilus sp.]|nr:hypothetical protein [Terracidiphilus sp.]
MIDEEDTHASSGISSSAAGASFGRRASSSRTSAVPVEPAEIEPAAGEIQGLKVRQGVRMKSAALQAALEQSGTELEKAEPDRIEPGGKIAPPAAEKAHHHREKAGASGTSSHDAARQPADPIAVGPGFVPSVSEAQLVARKQPAMVRPHDAAHSGHEALSNLQTVPGLNLAQPAHTAPTAASETQDPEKSVPETFGTAVTFSTGAERPATSTEEKAAAGPGASKALESSSSGLPGVSGGGPQVPTAEDRTSKMAAGSPQVPAAPADPLQTAQPARARGLQGEGARSAGLRDGARGMQPKDAGPDQHGSISIQPSGVAGVLPEAGKGSPNSLAGRSDTSVASQAFDALDASDGRAMPVWTHAGTNRAEAGYQDEQLGWVAVRAQMGANGIHAAVVPDSADAAQALGSHLASLGSYLAEHHMPIETVTMAAESHHEASTAMGHGNEQPGGGNAHQQKSSGPPMDSIREASRSSQSGPTGLGALSGPTAPADAAWNGGVHVSVIA